ncbi:hypothetical protein HK098_008206 [Nowakowskiella sp. JEL0407]|nr:hypothetical protein HK098_008206 [Nowakowskiella sp. JEL0407]
MAEEDLTGVCFKDTTFLQHNFLDQSNVITYFSLSQFYDRSCINEQILMQARFQAERGLLDSRGMTGVEYVVAEEYLSYQPRLFVIFKHHRFSKDRTELLATYYIIEGTIYQSPNLATLLSNRILTSLYYIQKGFHDIVPSVRFHPARGYTWESEDQYAEKQREQHKADKFLENSSVPSTPNDQNSVHTSVNKPKNAMAASAIQHMQTVEFMRRMESAISKLSGDGAGLKFEEKKEETKVEEITPESIKRKLLKQKEEQAAKEALEAKKRAELLADQRRAQEEFAARSISKRKKRLDSRTPGTPGSSGGSPQFTLGSPSATVSSPASTIKKKKQQDVNKH